MRTLSMSVWLSENSISCACLSFISASFVSHVKSWKQSESFSVLNRFTSSQCKDHAFRDLMEKHIFDVTRRAPVFSSGTCPAISLPKSWAYPVIWFRELRAPFTSLGTTMSATPTPKSTSASISSSANETRKFPASRANQHRTTGLGSTLSKRSKLSGQYNSMSGVGVDDA